MCCYHHCRCHRRNRLPSKTGWILIVAFTIYAYPLAGILLAIGSIILYVAWRNDNKRKQIDSKPVATRFDDLPKVDNFNNRFDRVDAIFAEHKRLKQEKKKQKEARKAKTK